jgi:hypothetical protein
MTVKVVEMGSPTAGTISNTPGIGTASETNVAERATMAPRALACCREIGCCNDCKLTHLVAAIKLNA